MENRTAPLQLQLLILCLGFSYVFLGGAVSLSRGPKPSRNLDPSVVGMVMVGQMGGQEMVMTVEENLGNGRMDLEISNDYPGSGANNRHEPKTPGGS